MIREGSASCGTNTTVQRRLAIPDEPLSEGVDAGMATSTSGLRESAKFRLLRS